MRYAQIFRYVLDLNESEHQERWMRPYADAIASVPGLIRKTWMADFDTRTFASVYVWENKAAMDAFMASPAIGKVAAEPFLRDLSITAIPVHEEASSITRG
jgi:quinol monooxygenase YgiN